MKALTLKALTVTAALGLCPLLLTAQAQADTPDVQLNSGAKITATILPAPSKTQIDPIVREGTAHLNLDNATRARYRYHNARWLFLTQQGQWLVDENGTWQAFDPEKYDDLVQYISSQTDQKASNETSQSNTASNNCYCYPTYQSNSYNRSYVHHRHHHHEFGGIHYGHWGTGFRNGFK